VHVSPDYATAVVPLSERRAPITMGLLWLTMVTGFITALMGVEWHKDGLTLYQIITAAALGGSILLVYTVPIAYISAITGKSYGLLNRDVFGERTAGLINALLVIIMVAFYGLGAVLLAEFIKPLFQLTLPTPAIAIVLAVLMIANNFFGFTGIANFARYVAAPVVILWICYTFGKTVIVLPTSALWQTPTHPFSYAVMTVSSYVVGVSIWGNEADYWRFGRPRFSSVLLPLICVLLLAIVTFPATGWMIAQISGATDFSTAVNFLNHYSFGGMPALAALVLIAAFFGANDSNLFASAAAVESLFSIAHKPALTILGLLGTLTAYALSALGAVHALESVAAVNTVILPTPTILVIAEYALCRMERQPIFSIPSSKYGILALTVGLIVGIVTSGLIPGLDRVHVGMFYVLAWLIALTLYIPLRLVELRRIARPALVIIESAVSKSE
jgi:purine-cytosine permease-like protein